MERFWNVFEIVTKVSKENGFHGKLVTKQNKCNNKCLSRISLYTFFSLKTEFENLKKDKRYTNSFQLFKFQMILIAKCQLLLIWLIIVIG